MIFCLAFNDLLRLDIMLLFNIELGMVGVADVDGILLTGPVPAVELGPLTATFVILLEVVFVVLVLFVALLLLLLLILLLILLLPVLLLLL